MMRRIYPDELYHYGVLGMKWGVRRYQNPDGTRTALGKARERAGNAFSSVKSKTKDIKNSKSFKKAKKAGKIAGVIGGLSLVGHAELANPGSIKRFFTERDKQQNNTTAAERTVKTINSASENRSRRKEMKDETKRRGEYRKQANRFTDAELRQRVNRLNLEKQFVDLSNQKATDGLWTPYSESEYRRSIMNDVVTYGTAAIGIASMASPVIKKALKAKIG